MAAAPGTERDVEVVKPEDRDGIAARRCESQEKGNGKNVRKEGKPESSHTDPGGSLIRKGQCVKSD